MEELQISNAVFARDLFNHLSAVLNKKSYERLKPLYDMMCLYENDLPDYFVGSWSFVKDECIEILNI